MSADHNQGPIMPILTLPATCYPLTVEFSKEYHLNAPRDNHAALGRALADYFFSAVPCVVIDALRCRLDALDDNPKANADVTAAFAFADKQYQAERARLQAAADRAVADLDAFDAKRGAQ